ncbi:hypothetical protein L9F63_018900, partial [Diploptera punctata]
SVELTVLLLLLLGSILLSLLCVMLISSPFLILSIFLSEFCVLQPLLPVALLLFLHHRGLQYLRTVNQLRRLKRLSCMRPSPPGSNAVVYVTQYSQSESEDELPEIDTPIS